MTQTLLGLYQRNLSWTYNKEMNCPDSPKKETKSRGNEPAMMEFITYFYILDWNVEARVSLM